MDFLLPLLFVSFLPKLAELLAAGVFSAVKAAVVELWKKRRPRMTSEKALPEPGRIYESWSSDCSSPIYFEMAVGNETETTLARIDQDERGVTGVDEV